MLGCSSKYIRLKAGSDPLDVAWTGHLMLWLVSFILTGNRFLTCSFLALTHSDAVPLVERSAKADA